MTIFLVFGVQVMLGVDRLDMIKGIPQKLLAFEKFLQEHEEWRDKVLLVQVRHLILWRTVRRVAMMGWVGRGVFAQ
jgi:trehalose-6-phosphate synthase